MGESIANRQAAGWPSPFRHTLILLLAAGIVSMVTAAFVSSTAATAATPLTALDNLALYASRGQPIHHCQTSWQQGHPATAVTTCTVIPELAPLKNRESLLQDGEFIWVEFTGETLSVDELIRLWGRPVLSRGQGNRVGLRWTLGAAGLSAWMFWGDPHKLPGTTILTLEALEDMGSTGPD